MQNSILVSLTRLSDAQLLSQLKSLVARERGVTAEIVAHLAELETRDVYLREGYPSLFVYCRDVLGLSEWEAYNRIEAARAARRFPLILDRLADGSVSLTAVKLLGPHLTPENHQEVLEAARGKRKAEIEELAARLSLRPDARSSIRRMPTPDVPGASVPVGSDPTLRPPVSDSVVVPPSRACVVTAGVAGGPSSPIPPAAVVPLSPDRYRFQVTIGGDTLEKIRLAKDMLGHANPSGDDAVLVDRAFTALLAELAKKKFAGTSRPRRSPRGKAEGRIPSTAIVKRPRTPTAAVKRAVWLRDLGRCAFIGTGGHRCNARRFVEFHHLDPYALGGEATVDGLQLRCRRHNDYESQVYFGNGRHRGELVPEQVRLSVGRSSRETHLGEVGAKPPERS